MLEAPAAVSAGPKADMRFADTSASVADVDIRIGMALAMASLLFSANHGWLQTTIREGIMISRRDLIICSAVTFAVPAVAQQGPRLFVLPKAVTSAMQSTIINTAKRRDLEGWLVCNGARVYRTAYPELFSSLGPNAGLGVDEATFLLPDLDVEYRDGQPVKGTAICPFSNFGTPAGVMMPFDVRNDFMNHVLSAITGS